MKLWHLVVCIVAYAGTLLRLVMIVRRERAEVKRLQAELGKHQDCIAAARLHEQRIAEAVRAGEREAAAMFVESHGKETLAGMIREGDHLTRLMKHLN